MSTSQQAPPQQEQPASNVENQQQQQRQSNGVSVPPASAVPPAGGVGVGGVGGPNQQQPVNFNNPNPNYSARRVTIGGKPVMSDGARRGSMGSGFGGMDEFFGRRPSFGAGFEMGGMDAFFGRRDSMDSTAAALDAAIMDLSRRRFSAAMGTPAPDPYAGQQGSMMGAGGGPGSGGPGSGGSGGSQAHDSIMQRQQQLQQQQRELEQRQKELEDQRRKLIANMQARSYNDPHPVMTDMHRSGSLGMSGSLGLGSVHSQGSASLPQTHRSSTASGGSGQNWWICQVCNSKAFASHEEAMQHEAVCQTSARLDPMQPLPMQRNYSMGLGMDASGRGMSMGMGTMDNSSRGVVSMGTDSSSRGSIGFMDMSATSHGSYADERTMSLGPFAMLSRPMPLAMPSDKDWLTPLHCFVRGHCVEVFTATEADVATPSKGKRKPIQVGQIGIRCPHCKVFELNGAVKARERGSVYYPTTIASIYNATMNLLQRHLHSCPAVPDEIMRRYETLKADDARSGTSKRYWVESARSLGLVDTPNGIRHSALRPPPLPTLTRQQESTGQVRRNSNEFFSTKSNATDDLKVVSQGSGTNEDGHGESGDSQSAPLVAEADKPYSTTFSFHLLSQMQPCVFTEADRLGKRKGLPPGFPGLACRHCFGGYGSGRFFPSSIKTLSDTSKTLNVLHNHMMRCRKCPAEVKEALEKLRGGHDEERAKMKFGSQKAFFARIWERLHGKDHPGTVKRLIAPAQRAHKPQQHPGMMMQQHHQQQQMYQRPPNSNPNSGLDALAAASSPSKRQKTH